MLLDVGTKGHELAINAVQDGLEIVTLTRIFTIEKFEEAAYKVMRHVLHDHILAQMNGQDKLEK